MQLQEAVFYVERHSKHPLRNLVMLLFFHKVGFEPKKSHLVNGLWSQIPAGVPQPPWLRGQGQQRIDHSTSSPLACGVSLSQTGIQWEVVVTPRGTFVTNAARKISEEDGGLGNVQQLADHANLIATQGYIEVDENERSLIWFNKS